MAQVKSKIHPSLTFEKLAGKAESCVFESREVLLWVREVKERLKQVVQQIQDRGGAQTPEEGEKLGDWIGLINALDSAAASLQPGEKLAVKLEADQT